MTEGSVRAAGAHRASKDPLLSAGDTLPCQELWFLLPLFDAVPFCQLLTPQLALGHCASDREHPGQHKLSVGNAACARSCIKFFPLRKPYNVYSLVKEKSAADGCREVNPAGPTAQLPAGASEQETIVLTGVCKWEHERSS